MIADTIKETVPTVTIKREEFLKDHPFIDNFDFTHVSFHSTMYEDDGDTRFDLFFSFAKLDDDKYINGMIYRPNLNAETLPELSEKLHTLLEMGFFMNLTVLQYGDLSDGTGETIGYIDWEELSHVSALENAGYYLEKMSCDCPPGVCMINDDEDREGEEI